MRKSVVVIPCYNERARLDAELVRALTTGDDAVSVLLVDDGSSDGTGAFIAEIAADIGPDASYLVLTPNRGKAEAVRHGLLRAIADGAAYVGYADADFATSATELKRLEHELRARALDVVMGSRVGRLGADIDRSAMRHLSGRVFATVASLALDATVYDTQCGAKWFRVDARLERVLSVPFTSRWAFDVELLGRLLGRFGVAHPEAASLRIAEIPLDAWRDVGGSKLDLGGMLQGFGEVCVMFARARRRR